MLDQVSIFTNAGVVLWSKKFIKIKGKDLVGDLINIILEEKAGDNVCTLRNYVLKWVRVNKNGLEIFIVVAHSSLLILSYVDDLLEAVKKNFLRQFQDNLKDVTCVSIDYEKDFNIILRAAEAKNIDNKKQKKSSKKIEKPVSVERIKDIEITPEVDSDDNEAVVEDISNDPAAIRSRILGKKGNKMIPRKAEKAIESSKYDNTFVTKKSDRVWTDGKSGKLSKKQRESLDRSKTIIPSETELRDSQDRELEQTRAIYMPSKDEKPLWEKDKEEAEEFERALQDMSIGGDAEGETSSNVSGWGQSYFGNMLQTITGNKILTEEDLQPVLHDMNQMLQGKNVAQEIADDICASVGTSLIGHQLASFTRISAVVIDALRDSVQRILTPSSSVDVLRQVLDARSAGKVFSAVFVGINGVGKSTSLAKVAYYLKQHGIKVLIAACDTFRSGAVEQLRTHSRCLDVPLFEMGYSKDPANVASCAISHAKTNEFDCVLIDTAGRMQNNEPLMKSLAKLVSDNSPNLVLFVGEALVGNDGIDQLSMFNRALINYSPPGKVHRIDGIVLTKFDTIDDKVGAALSMSYKSGKPVTFVGTGQKYTHLKKLNVNVVVKHLFS